MFKKAYFVISSILICERLDHAIQPELSNVQVAIKTLNLPSPPAPNPAGQPCPQTAGRRLGGSIHVSSNGSVRSAEKAKLKKGPQTGLLYGQIFSNKSSVSRSKSSWITLNACISQSLWQKSYLLNSILRRKLRLTFKNHISFRFRTTWTY